jgi:hypothetical protein
MATLQEQIEKAVREAVHRDRYRDSPKDREVARHELGHALADFVCHPGLMHSVVMRDDGSGEVLNRTLPRPAGMSADESEDEIIARLRSDHPAELEKAMARGVTTLLAGREADLFGEEMGFPPVPAGVSRNDFEEADRRAVLAVGREGRDRLIEACRAQAAEIVRAGWPIIHGDLEALLVYERELPGPVVETLMEERPLACSLREAYPLRTPSTSGTPLPPAPDADDWWSDD